MTILNEAMKATILDCYMLCDKDRGKFIELVKATTGLINMDGISGYLETLVFNGE